VRSGRSLVSRAICIALLVCAAATGVQGQEQITRDLERAANLVVRLETRLGDRTVFGAGLVVGRERDAVIVVTANHVVRQGALSAERILVRFKSAPKMELTGVLLPKFDRNEDVAVLRVERMLARAVDPCALPPPRFDEGLLIRRGHGVFPIGNPGGVPWQIPTAPDQVMDVTDREIRFQSALIESGHSGGGLFNAFGDLAGMIKADQPPYGVAVRLDRLAQLLRNWGLPFQGESSTGRPEAANAADAAGASRKAQPDPCGAVTARPPDKGTVVQDSRGPLPASPERWGLEGSDTRWIPLFEAVRQGRADDVKRMVDAKALDPDGYHPPFPLHWAAAFGQVNVVKQLLLMGARKNAWVQSHMPGAGLEAMGTPLHVATMASQLDVMKVLINAGANLEEGEDLDQGPGTPLTVAARHGLIAPAKVLITARANVEAGARFFRGAWRTPLAQAVRNGHVEMIKLLERSGARLAADYGEFGRPALLGFAAEAGQLDSMRYLISRGVPLDCSAEATCDSPLYNALLKEQIDAVQLLLQAGANPNKNGGGEVYLEVALRFKDLRALKLLLKAGADPSIRNKDGESILSVALRNENQTAVDLLKAYGAKK
jgi:ankyrin repeat protein